MSSGMSSNNFLDKVKAMGRTVVDSGAKTMLKTDLVFLEREIKNRKQSFGVEIYDLMAQLEVDDGMSVEEKEGKIRLSFDQARKDIAVVQAKIDCKKEEMESLEHHQSGGAASTQAMPAQEQGASHVITTGHPDDE